MRHIALALVFVLFVAGLAVAQAPPNPPVAPPAAVPPKPADAPKPVAEAEKPPEVPQQVREAIGQMQLVASGHQRSIAVLQKEIDAINAEYSRLLPQLQVPGWTLDQRTLTYTKPEPPKTAPPAPAATAPTTKK